MNLYVGNLPHSTTEMDLRSLFSTHGQVDSVSIITDRETGRSRGFAFVEMADSEAAQRAIAALDGTELGGRALKINEAKPKADRPRSGGQRFARDRGADDYRGRGGHRREPRW
jgi:cold-inducible RNA-binding protein